MRITQSKGFTLLETLISIAILLIIITSTYSLILGILNFVASSKAKDIATSLAGNRLETIRNMPFSEVKTQQGWSPPGTIPNQESIYRNGVNFNINTSIAFVECPFEENCQDLLYQYKRITVNVSWDKFPGQPVSISTDITPRNGEGLDPDLGYFWIKVFNASGQGIQDALVNVNNSANGYTLSANTNQQGFLYVTDIPPLQGYTVNVSKNEMSSDQTYSDQDLIDMGYPNAVVDTSKSHLNAIAGKLIEASFSIDFLTDVNISTINADTATNIKINQTSSNLEEITHTTEGNGNSYFLMKTSIEPQRIFLQKTDSNLNVLFATDLDLTGANNNFNATLLEDGDYLYMIWARGATGNSEIYVQKFSKINGQSLYASPIKLSDNGHIDNFLPTLTSLEDNKLTAVWLENVSGNRIFKWMRLDKDDGDKDYGESQDITGTFAMPSSPTYDICSLQSNSKTVIAYTDNSNGNLDIYAQIFDKDFNSLSPKFLIHETNTSDQSQPDIFCKDDGITFAWSGGSLNDTKIRLSRFDWNASRVDPFLSDVTLASIQDYAQTNPDIIITPSNELFGVWLDNRNGNNEVYAQKLSSTNTKTFSSDFKVSTSNNQYSKYSPTISFLAVDSTAIASFMDNSEGNLNLYASEVPSNENSNVLANVPITLTGGKKLGTYDTDNKPIYKNIHSLTTDALGKFSLQDIEWDSYTLSTTSPYTLIDSFPISPVSVLPEIVINLIINLEL